MRDGLSGDMLASTRRNLVVFGFTSFFCDESQSIVFLLTVSYCRYACPDLTNKPGYWAKALPERMAEEGNVLFFYITRQGNCMFGLNNKEKGVFFSGVNVNNFLYPLVDIYGNTMAMEFVGKDYIKCLTSLWI